MRIGWLLVSGFSFLASGSRFLFPGCRFLVSAFSGPMVHVYCGLVFDFRVWCFCRFLVCLLALCFVCCWCALLTCLPLQEFCSMSPPGGNQVDGLPPAVNNKRIGVFILARGSASFGKSEGEFICFEIYFDAQCCVRIIESL